MYIIQNFQDVPRFAEKNMSHCDTFLSFDTQNKNSSMSTLAV